MIKSEQHVTIEENKYKHMKHFLLAIAAIFFGITLTFGQDLEKNWQFEA